MAGSHGVLIVEDDPDTRERLVRAAACVPHVEVCGAAGDCAAARTLFATQKPRIVLVDLGLPDGRGSALIREFRALDADALFMVITALGDELNVVEAIEAGASSYLLKDASDAQLGRAIQELLDGGSPISPAVARHILKRMQTPMARKADAEPERAALSERERAVLDLVAKGYSYAEIGSALTISINTVGTYIRHIYRKLGVSSRGEAVFEALQRGLIHHSPP